MSARVLMLVINPMTADARVHKEARSLAAAGYTVDVVATAAPGLPAEEVVDGYRLVRIPYRRVVREAIVDRYRRASERLRDERRWLQAAVRQRHAGNVWAVMLRCRLAANAGRRILARLRWLIGGAILKVVRTRLLTVEYRRSIGAEILRRWQPVDVIHAHDLGPLSTALWLAGSWANGATRPRVIYDSHELYVEQLTKWTARERHAWRLHERRMIKRVDAVVTVSPGIAEELHRRYRLPATPTVVLNAPVHPGPPCDRDLRSDLPVVGKQPLMVYVGAVKPGRGVEHLLPALALADAWHLALVGAGDTDHVATVLAQAEALGVGGRLHVVPAVPSDELPAYIASADVGIHPMEPSCLNHELALPNKLFDYLFAGLPLAVSDLSEMRRFVSEHGVGVVFDVRDPSSIAQAAQTLLREASRFRPGPEGLRRFDTLYSWPVQQRRLEAVYQSLAPLRSC